MFMPFANGCFLHRSLSQLKIGIRQDGSRQKWGPQPRQVNSLINKSVGHSQLFSPFLPSDSYLPANWALRRQQREDIEEDEYVTVSKYLKLVMSQVISGHKFGFRWQEVLGYTGIGVDMRYATPVPIVPYSCDPLQGSDPPSLSKRPR